MIGSWYCVPEAELSEAALREYADAGFTHFQTLDLIGDRWVPYSREGNLRALELCRAVGLGCFVVDERLYRDGRPYTADRAPRPADLEAALSDYPDAAGFLLYDEPSPHMFPALADTMRRLVGKTPLVPLFPKHDDPRFPNAFEGRTYEQYLREFVATCRPPALAYDYYPFMDPPARMPEYVENFDIARRVADDAGLPLWYYPACVGVTPGQLRYQVNMALAYGARALFHFTYRSDERIALEALREVNHAALAHIRATADRRVLRVEHFESHAVAVLDEGAFVVNTDWERDRTVRVRGVQLDLPAGGARLV